MLVHAATAPNAVLRTLPVLPRELWGPSLRAVWCAVAALTTAYGPKAPAAPSRDAEKWAATMTADEVFAQAAAHGDEHVIKFADTALEVAAGAPDGDHRAQTAALYAQSAVEPGLASSTTPTTRTARGVRGTRSAWGTHGQH